MVQKVSSQGSGASGQFKVETIESRMKELAHSTCDPWSAAPENGFGSMRQKNAESLLTETAAS